jgi:hypothetical protein
MPEPLLAATPTEYFRDLVESALARQRLQATELTSYYLVYHEGDEPLAVRLLRALQSGGMEQRERLRNVGDFSLFTSGFFSDSLRRKTVDVDYYVHMGEYAYGSLSLRDKDAFGDVFSELASRFVVFSDVLADVSDHTSLASRSDIFRLYERWLRTGSQRDGQRLIERGVTPNSSVGTRFIQ